MQWRREIDSRSTQMTGSAAQRTKTEQFPNYVMSRSGLMFSVSESKKSVGRATSDWYAGGE